MDEGAHGYAKAAGEISQGTDGGKQRLDISNVCSNSGRVSCGALAIGGKGLRHAAVACDGVPRRVHGSGGLIRFCCLSALPITSLLNSARVI